MNPIRSSLALLAALSVAAAPALWAQRRTTGGGGGGGGGGRSAPAVRGGGTTGGGSRAPSGATRREGSTPGGSNGATPPGGKIGALKQQAQSARARARPVGPGIFIGSCWSCNTWGWYGGAWGWYHGGWWYPAAYPPPDDYPGEPESGGEGQGYAPYPYAEGGGAAFVERHAPRHAYGAVSALYFSDVGSTTRAGQFGLEGAIGVVRGELEYGSYREPVQGLTNRLQTWHLGLAGQPRIGDNASVVAGIAARGVILDDGSHAWGPEGELGLQVFPVRPFGLNVTGRLGELTWNGASDSFTFQELNTTGSVFINRVELQAGWHWMKVGSSPAFGGPIAGLRVWF